MMVVAVVGIAAVLGYVMLSTATMQNRAGGNQVRLVSADYLAESGLNVAMYYLQYPAKAPSLNGDGYWPGTTANYTLPNGLPATLAVAVTKVTGHDWTYELTSAATVGAYTETRITRTAGARVYVRNEYVVKQAATFNHNTTLYGPITVVGDVYSSKSLALRIGVSAPTVSGIGYCKTATTGIGWGTPAGGWKAITSNAATVPATGEVNLYKSYTFDDAPYTAEPLAAGPLTGSAGVPTLAKSLQHNPAGIFYRNATSGGAFVLGSNVTIYGTLVVEGDLQIQGSNILIKPEPGYPALIVTGTLEIFHPGNSLTVNGAVYVGTALKSSGTLPAAIIDQSKLIVNGGLLFGTTSSSAAVPSNFNVRTTVTYNAANAKAPELSPVARSPKGVSIVRWGLP